MRKVYYISILTIAVLFASCQKQEIVPVSNEALTVPTWEDNAKSDTGGGDNNGPTHGNTGDDSGLTGEITDPNNDPDGTKGKGKR